VPRFVVLDVKFPYFNLMRDPLILSVYPRCSKSAALNQLTYEAELQFLQHPFYEVGKQLLKQGTYAIHLNFLQHPAYVVYMQSLQHPTYVIDLQTLQHTAYVVYMYSYSILRM
jgi:hypothetical protein